MGGQNQMKIRVTEERQWQPRQTTKRMKMKYGKSRKGQRERGWNAREAKKLNIHKTGSL